MVAWGNLYHPHGRPYFRPYINTYPPSPVIINLSAGHVFQSHQCSLVVWLAVDEQFRHLSGDKDKAVPVRCSEK
ncbi:hypothetical protein KI387_024930, partial [Taxus chinensis]